MAAADDDALFPLPPVEETDAVQKEEPGPVEKSFRPYDPNQVLLLPPSLEEWLPERHLARFVSELVEEALNLSAIRAAYTEERGYPPYDPRLMVKLLIYGYCTGQRWSRVIEKRCWDDVGFRYLVAGAAPDDRSIARFRRRHREALAGLFLQALPLCQQAGMVRLGKVALDGTKLRANASRHKAMSYKRMVEREKQLEAEIDRMLAEAERQDAKASRYEKKTRCSREGEGCMVAWKGTPVVQRLRIHYVRKLKMKRRSAQWALAKRQHQRQCPRQEYRSRRS